MNKFTKIGAIAITTTALGLVSLSTLAGSGGHGNDGGSQGGQGGQHEQMMGQGSGNGMGSHMEGGKGSHMGKGMGGKMNLSAEEVKTLVEAKLIMRGNDRLKVGKVNQKDDQTYVVDIVTVDDSLVRQIEVDKNSGLRHGMNRFDK